MLGRPVPLIPSRLIPRAPIPPHSQSPHPPCPVSVVGTQIGSFFVAPEMQFATREPAGERKL